MDQILREIAAQPDCWREVADRADRLGELLPVPGQRVAVVGCGSSWFVAQSAASLRQAHGDGDTEAFHPAALLAALSAGRHYDAVVAISRSGTTSEVLWLLDRLPVSTPRHAVTLDGATPLARAVTAAVVLDFVHEESVVQTVSATTAVALFRALAGHELVAPAEAAESVLAGPPPVSLDGAARHVFLGRGWAEGLAHEAALKYREAAGVWAESYPDREYLHGPRSASDTATVVWAIGDVAPDVLDASREAGNRVIASRGDPLADLVGVQRAAVAEAVRRGRDPQSPPWLTRSVVLEG